MQSLQRRQLRRSCRAMAKRVIGSRVVPLGGAKSFEEPAKKELQ